MPSSLCLNSANLPLALTSRLLKLTETLHPAAQHSACLSLIYMTNKDFL